MGLSRRLWLGVAEVGMAFAGLVVGWLVIGTLLGLLDAGPFHLVAGPVITAFGAVFYWWVGPRWAAATRDEDDEIVDVLPEPSLGGSAAASVVLLGIAAALGGSIVLGLLLELIDLGVEEQSSVLRIASDARSGGPALEAIVLAVSALLLAPVAEEYLFRRLLFTRVMGTSGRVIAYGGSALCFAAIHGNPAGIVIYLWLGLVFAAVLERTGRLWTAVAVHMGNNAYVLAVLFFGVEQGM